VATSSKSALVRASGFVMGGGGGGSDSPPLGMYGGGGGGMCDITLKH